MLAAAVIGSAATVGTAAAAGVSPSVKAAGVYSASFPDVSGASELVISNDPGVSKKEGTFALTAFGDTGNWAISGKTIALFITSDTGDSGIVLVGNLSESGIIGLYAVVGEGVHSWSATKNAPPAPVRAHGSGLRSGRRASAVHPAAKAAGSYTEHFDFGFTDSLTVVNDSVSKLEGTYSEALGDAGHWVVLGRQFAMGAVTGPDAGLVSIGKLGAPGISTPEHPGVYAFPGVGAGTWYATKP
jgi:hypothetical protein